MTPEEKELRAWTIAVTRRALAGGTMSFITRRVQFTRFCLSPFGRNLFGDLARDARGEEGGSNLKVYREAVDHAKRFP